MIEVTVVQNAETCIPKPEITSIFDKSMHKNKTCKVFSDSCFERNVFTFEKDEKEKVH